MRSVGEICVKVRCNVCPKRVFSFLSLGASFPFVTEEV